MILSELEKLRTFLGTRVPYMAMLLGIFTSIALLSVEDGVKSVYLTPAKMPVFREVPLTEEPEFSFSVCCSSCGYSSLEIFEGAAYSFAFITSTPANAAAHTVMSLNIRREPGSDFERTRRTFIFLFVYFNAYFWMLGAFVIYSIHWETIRDPISPPTSLGLNPEV